MLISNTIKDTTLHVIPKPLFDKKIKYPELGVKSFLCKKQTDRNLEEVINNTQSDENVPF